MLRLHKLTETSLIVIWLTRDHGKLKTVAKGARRPKSPFRGRLDLFYHDELQFLRSAKSELHVLQEAALVDAFVAIRTDLQALRLATYFVVLCDAMTVLEHPVPELFDQLEAFLGVLGKIRPSRELALAFEFRLLDVLGIGPKREKLELPRGTAVLLEHLRNDPFPRLARLKISYSQAKQLDALSLNLFSPYLRSWPASREAAVAIR